MVGTIVITVKDNKEKIFIQGRKPLLSGVSGSSSVITFSVVTTSYMLNMRYNLNTDTLSVLHSNLYLFNLLHINSISNSILLTSLLIYISLVLNVSIILLPSGNLLHLPFSILSTILRSYLSELLNLVTSDSFSRYQSRLLLNL